MGPLGLEGTRPLAPGDGSFGGPFAHGYMQLGGELVETSHVDPSMAGSAGGNALVTTTGDLVRFFDALLAGKLFRRPETLKAMTTFRAASGEPGQVGYGLGLVRGVFPRGVETIDHLGGTGGSIALRFARLPCARESRWRSASPPRRTLPGAPPRARRSRREPPLIAVREDEVKKRAA